MSQSDNSNQKKISTYTFVLPSDQMSALQSVWLELKKAYGNDSPDKSNIVDQAIANWLKSWESELRNDLLADLLEKKNTSKNRRYRRSPKE